MACIRILHNGTKYWMCGNFDPVFESNNCCAECGEYAPGFLCDFPVGNDKTCDRKLCENCADEIGPELHYCKNHSIEFKKFRDSGGIEKELKNVVPYKRKIKG
jgi:hypothetical protein